MKFSKKIFLAVFLSTLLVSGSILWASYFYTKSQVQEDFINRYEVFSSVLGNTLTQLDTRTEDLMYNAAKFVAERDREKGLLSTAELQGLRDDLNVSHIFMVDKTGKFIRSTNEDPSLIPNAFSFCSKYRNLVTGESKVEATPIVHPEPEPKPYKFLFVPTQNRERLVEVGVRVDFITKTLSEALSSDRNILSLSLYSPHGKLFGNIKSDTIEFKEEAISLPETFPSFANRGDYFEFYTKVASSHPYCCQCDVSGTSKNGEYYYVLSSKVSKGEIKSILATTSWGFGLTGILLIFVAYFFGSILSKRLVQNIVKAKEKIRAIKASGSLSGRVQLEGKDEIAFLTNEFDKTLDSLESAQSKLLEVERSEARSRLANEIAHNIKSPLVAMEMVIPSLFSSPSSIKGILTTSIKDIKTLVEKLNKCVASDKPKDFQDENEVVSVRKILEEVETQKRFEYGGKIEFREISTTIKTDALVKLNRTEFRAILSNLINNAVEASDCPKAKVEWGIWIDSSHQCRIVIRDKGDGMTEETIDKLGKEKFSTKPGCNRGNGFLHANDYIKKLGGDLKIESSIGGGTEVKISLPLYGAYQKECDQQEMPNVRGIEY